jgi:hypothetical protein
MGDVEPIQSRMGVHRGGLSGSSPSAASPSLSPHAVTAFTRAELSAILAVYGRLMAEGECRDYAMDFGRETAVFSIFRRTSEVPLYRIEKTPKLARKQGAYSVVMPTGLILKRGHELARVLDVLATKIRVVAR